MDYRKDQIYLASAIGPSIIRRTALVVPLSISKAGIDKPRLKIQTTLVRGLRRNIFDEALVVLIKMVGLRYRVTHS